MRHGTKLFSIIVGFTVIGVGEAWAQEATPPPPPAASCPGCDPCDAPATTAAPMGEPMAAPTVAPAETAPPAAAAPAPYYTGEPRRRVRVFAPREIAVSGGGGVANYVGGAMRADSDTGAAWDARVTVGTRSILAVEAGYVGSVNRVDGAVNDGHISSHGVDGDLRIQLPYRVQPYVFGGVGYNRMHLNSEGMSDPFLAASFRRDDNQLAVPAGGGVSAYLGRHRHATLDARFTYRALFDNEFNRIDNGERMDQWSVLGRAGYAF
jgi:opacity protein-like surface antigen